MHGNLDEVQWYVSGLTVELVLDPSQAHHGEAWVGSLGQRDDCAVLCRTPCRLDGSIEAGRREGGRVPSKPHTAPFEAAQVVCLCVSHMFRRRRRRR